MSIHHMPWTKFRPFTDFIVIHPFVGGRNTGKNTLITTIGEYSGGFSTDEGLEPVSGELLDCKKNWPVALGIYWLRIESEAAQGKHKSGYFDYIGKSALTDNKMPEIKSLGKYADSERDKKSPDKAVLSWIEGKITDRKKKHMKRSKSSTYGIFRRIQEHYLKIARLPIRDSVRDAIKDIYDLEKISKLNDPAADLLKDQEFKDYKDFRTFFKYKKNVEKNGQKKGQIAYKGTENFDAVFDLLNKHHELNTHEDVKHFFEEHVSLRFLDLVVRGNNEKDRMKSVERPDFFCDVETAEAVAILEYFHHYHENPYFNKKKEYEEYIEKF